MKTVKLGDVCNLTTGGTPSRTHKEYFEGGSIRWLVSGDIHKGEIFDCDGRITKLGLKSSNTRLLPVNSVMIALNGQGKTRATVAMLRVEATCNQSLVSIYPKDDTKVLPEWIFWNLRGRYDELRKCTGDSGNERRGLNMIIIRDIDLPVPPSLENQRRVVERLDADFEKIDRAIELTEKNVENVRKLYGQVLKNAFSDAQNWERQLFEKNIKFIDYRGKTPKKTKTGLRLITAKNIKLGSLNLEPREYVDPEIYDSWMVRGIPREGDVLFTTEAPLANVAQLDTDEKVVFAQRCIILHPERSIINPSFLKYMLLTNPVRQSVFANATGTTVSGIRSALLKKIEIFVPDLELQNMIVSRLDKISGQITAAESLYQKKINYLKTLKQSLLTQAFSLGEVE